MKKIYFVVDWDTPKEKTWSGTVFGLYTSLKKRFLIDELGVSLKPGILRRILLKLGLVKNDLSLKNIKKERSKLSKNVNINKSSIIFQFAEVFDSESFNNTYLYIDLSVPYLQHLAQTNSSVYNYSGFSQASIGALNTRAYEQNNYMRHAKGIFTMGEWLKEDLVHRHGIQANKVHCVGGGINVDKEKINTNSEKQCNKILFIGRDFKRKGGYLVYDAFCELLKKQPNAELHIAGPNTHPISNPVSNCFYHGDCNHNTLSDLFNKCDVFCMPSYFEAYGLVFIEALCYGLPCIGRNCYEMPYFIKDGVTGLLIEDDNVSNLASCMHRLLHDKNIKNEVLSRKDIYLNKYSWDSVADRIKAVIDKDTTC